MTTQEWLRRYERIARFLQTKIKAEGDAEAALLCFHTLLCTISTFSRE
jgi:hypothetical protein